jgi:homoserine dehydrogenase
MEPLGVGLLGVGTVGTGVARLLGEAADRVAARAGRPIEVVRAAVRDADKPRSAPIPPDRLTDDWRRVVADPRVAVVAELMGGTVEARAAVLAAFEAGKDVVTANKALLAEHGPEVFAAARRAGRALAFEASVGGGIPIVQALSVGLAANQVQGLAAIVNGTCNFILTAMTREGLPYAEALARAQSLGYAEADPTLDVDGTDTAHKLAILAQLAFGAGVTTASIPRQGIDKLQAIDIRFAGELGYTVKLLAKARLGPGGLELRVAPSLVRRGTPLAEVSGAYNAIRVVGDAVGDTLFYGRGAGMMPTASAVVGDLIDVAVGRARLTAGVQNLWPESAGPARLAAPGSVPSRAYLRFTIADRPGVLAMIAQVLGMQGISIASVIQHDPGDDDHPDAPVPLILMTHAAGLARLDAALGEIAHLDAVRAPSVRLDVEE